MSNILRPSTAPNKNYTDEGTNKPQNGTIIRGQISDLKKMRLKKQKDRMRSHQQVINETYSYLARKVDPLMSEAITYLLVLQPDDVASTLLTYLENKKNHITLDPFDILKNNKRINQRDRLFMARSISPLLTKLMNRLMYDKPEEVEDYIINQLKQILEDNSEFQSNEIINNNTDHIESKLTTPKKIIEKNENNNNVIVNDENVDIQQTNIQDNNEIINNNEENIIKREKRNIVLLLLGIDGAGKTTLIKSLKGATAPNPKPSHGFRKTDMQLDEFTKVSFYDLGGSPKIRGIWSNYFHDVHGVIYIVDSSENDRWEESKENFVESMNHKYLIGKPCLMLANKQDQEHSRNPNEIANEFKTSLINQISNNNVEDININDVLPNEEFHSIGTILNAKYNQPSCDIDSNIEIGLEWILEKINNSYIDLNERVENDLKDMEAEYERQKIEKQHRVIKTLLRKAFPLEGDEKEDCFDEEEGLKFLSGELGESPETIPDIGKEIASLVGYQKLALQMVGDMKFPISSKKTPMEWDDIKNLILQLRNEVFG